MRKLLSERNIIIILFIAVLVLFSLAQEDTRKMKEDFYNQHSVSPNSNSIKSEKLASNIFQEK